MKKLRVLLSSFFLIAIIILSFAGVYHRQSIQDWYRLRNYQPSARIVQLADSTKMTDYGRKLWYVNRPELLDKAGFAENCNLDEKSIVLGCYISNQQIYIFDVKDERLAGIHEVTAAHEMLHEGYTRLSGAEREYIDNELQSVLATIKDERILETVQSYKERDATVLNNELHSILATEVKELNPQLESYYSRYFSDRKVVVDFALRYEEEFSSRKRRVAVLQTEMDNLAKTIDSEKVVLKNQEGVINAAKSELDALLQAKRIEEYNAQVPIFNQKVNAYNSTIARIQLLIDTFNKKAEEHNAIAEEQKTLIDAIDSRADAQLAQ